MGRRANGEGTVYKTIQKVKRKKILEKECHICANCTDRSLCNNRVGYDKCDKCKNCKTECLKYCDRFYCQELWVGQATVNGKTKTLSTGSKQRDVSEKKQEIQTNFKNGFVVEKNNMSISDLCRDEIETRHAKGKTKETSHKRLLETLKRIEKADFAFIPLQQLEKNNSLVPCIKKFFSAIKKEYSKSVIDKIWQLLSAAFRRAVKYKLITTNPLLFDDDLEKPKSVKTTKKVISFTVEEEKLFLDVISNNDVTYKYQYLIELISGLRMGEINALDKDKDIDFKNKTLTVRHTVTKDMKDRPILGNAPKTDAGYRTTIITPTLEKVLLLALENWKPNKHNLLFYNHKSNSCISTSAVNSAFNRLCKKYNIAVHKDVNQHMLRHTYATRAIEAGVSVDVVAKLLGHTDISITLNTYCDVFALREAKQLAQIEKYYQEENINFNV